jgi:hypothetical protein
MFNLISSFAALASVTSARKIWIDSEDRLIRDEHDRHMIFHGVNVVYKTAPYIPESEIYDS